MMKFLRVTMDSEYSEKQLQLRADCLGILLKYYGNINIHEATYSTQDIYECADERCKKQHTTSGLVAYIKAYNVQNEDHASDQIHH